MKPDIILVTKIFARTQERLLKQYSALDTQMGQLSSLSTYMSSQVAQWNKS